MIYGNITYATLTGGGSGGNAYQVRFGYEILSEDIASNSRQVKLQLEVRSVKSAYGTFGFNQTTTIDGSALSSATFDMRNTNVWQIFGNKTITINGAYNGTKSGNFITDATTSSGNYTLKSGSANVYISLSSLHQQPILTDVVFTEQNSTLSNLGVGGEYFVPYLSIKKAKITAQTFDDATISQYQLINGTNNYSSQSDEVTINLQQNDLYTIYSEQLHRNIVELYVKLTDSLGGVSQYAFPATYVIPYTKPNIEKTSSGIKRKSGGGVNLTDNKAELNLKANIYKNNDLIGNNNTITQIGYKIWDSDTTEPANYTPITPIPTPDSNGNITVSNLEINNISYTDTYNYKIIITDNYGYSASIDDGSISIGISTWTEYKDRVDFLKLTVGGYNPFEYSENETIVGIWLDKPLYRKTYIINGGISQGIYSVAHSINNIDVIFVNGSKSFMFNNNNKISYPFPINQYNGATSYDQLGIYVDNTNINFFAQTSWGTTWEAYITLEYTKTTD